MMDAAQYAFLGDRSQSTYISNVLRRASDATKQSLKAGCKSIEIAFPENRKSDISVSESLDTNRAFAKEFAKSLASYGKSLWILFPDNKELKLAADKWGNGNSFTLTSLDGAARVLNAADSDSSGDGGDRGAPEVVMALNPGFNVEEWIKLAELNVGNAAVIVINGNLDRLRNGYYPRIFYPKLGRVTDSYYRRFEQSFCISPVAVGGDRQGAWLCKQTSSPWQLLVKERTSSFSASSSTSSSSSSSSKASSGNARYVLREEYDTEPQPQKLWGVAKRYYQEEFGTLF